LDHRLSVTRILRWTHPALGSLGLLALMLAGCRSNAQQDLIARELRMQEDQLYAMEDYISQYQQLVCKYRSENAALRRQLADDYYDADDGELPAPGSGARPLDERRSPSRGPTFQAPETPRRNGTAPSDTQLEVPEVPPLEGSTSSSADSNVAAASYTDAGDPVGAATSVAVNDRSADKPLPAQLPTTNPAGATDPSSNEVSLRGEVIANDAGGGPRLMVDVERLDPVGSGTRFDGTLSLLLLERSENDSPQNLARWDFTAADVRSAAEPTAGDHAMRFYLELPADVPSNNATEIWVRLLPRDGTKLLAHADVNLRQPGEFASSRANLPEATSQAAPIVASSSRTDEASSVPSSQRSNAGEGEWMTARADQLADLANEKKDTGQWRASSEPMPVVQSSFATAPVSRPVQRAAFFDTIQATKPARTYARPTWSPDRSGSTASVSRSGIPQRAAVSQVPVWSDTR
jgi:hypothetical protein